MKKLVLSLTIVTMSIVANAQTTAQDWTLTDCNSNSHTLFNYLDAEEVVVMEFGMGCGSCYAAADGLYSLKLKYAVDQPGKVNFFYMDYWSGNTCVGDVDPVLAASPLDAGFINCNTQKAYYMTGSPMPGVVIVAGSNHAVIYEKNSFAYSDTTNMITAIDNFFATVGLNEIANEEMNVYPNPTQGFLSIENTLQGNLTITDINGKVVYSGVKTSDKVSLDVTGFTAGIYFIELSNESATTRLKFLKQ